MVPIEDDDRPTVTSSGKGAAKKPGTTFGTGGQFEVEERPTIVRPKGPQPQYAAWLYCKKGVRKGQLYQMKQARCEFGRAADCDIQIEDDFSSNHHGAVLLEDGAWKVFDFASTNGTLVNGKRLGKDEANPVILKDGDVIAIGDSEFVFKCVE